MPVSPVKRKVIHVITDYVNACGGIVALDYLLQDYETSYHHEIPFTKFGFSTIEDFLVSIDGISICENVNGEIYVEIDEQHDDRRTNEVDDLTQLSVQMKNSLLLDCNNNSRVVKVQSPNCTKVSSHTNSSLSNCGEEVNGDKYRSLPNLDSSSTREYSQNNSTRPRSNNYVFKRVRPLTHESHSTNAKITSGKEDCDVPEDCQKSEEKVAENIYSSDTRQSSTICMTAATDFLKPHENLYSLEDENRTNDATYSSIYAQNEGAPNLTRPAVSDALKSHERLNAAALPPMMVHSVPSLQHIFETQDDHIPWRHQSASPPDISSMNLFSSSLPRSNSTRAFRPILTSMEPTSSTNLFIKPKPHDMVLLKGLGDWIPEEAYTPSLTNNWQDNLPKLTDVEITDRIVRIVNSHNQFGGIDASIVELKYKEKYSTRLPKEWLKLLQERGVLYIEELTSCAIVYPTRFFPVPPTIGSLPPLRYPNIDHYFWNVRVTLYESTTCVWFRLKDEDFDQKYEILQREMNKYHSRVTDSIEYSAEVSKGQLCAVNYGKQWSRSEVLESDAKDGWVKCLLLDEGNIQNFPSDKVYPLHEKFTNTPALILQGQLYSLEKWENCNYVNCKIRQQLLDKPDVTIKIHKFLSHNTVSMQVYLDSQSGRLDLNSKMVDLARSELSLPVLNAGQIYDIDILKVAGNDNSFQIHVESPSLRLLKETLHRVNKVMKIPEEAKIKTTLGIVKDKIYLARCGNDWKRIISARFLAEDHFVASFIDFGYEDVVYLHEVFDTSIAQDAVCVIEPQAVRIRVLDRDHIALRYLEYIQIRQTAKISYAMKVLQTENTPSVQLFVRIPGSEQPVPIIDILGSLECEIPHTSQYRSVN